MSLAKIKQVIDEGIRWNYNDVKVDSILPYSFLIT
jgi:hypothetical protein